MTAYDVFASGATGAPFLQYKRGAFEDPDGTPVAFTIDLQAKDLELISGLAERVGAPMRQGGAPVLRAARAPAQLAARIPALRISCVHLSMSFATMASVSLGDKRTVR